MKDNLEEEFGFGRKLSMSDKCGLTCVKLITEVIEGHELNQRLCGRQCVVSVWKLTRP